VRSSHCLPSLSYLQHFKESLTFIPA